jgi:hypothetical protein
MPLLSESENHYNMNKYLIITIYLIANTLHAQYEQGILFGGYSGVGMNYEKLKTSHIGLKLGYQFYKGIEVFGELQTLHGGIDAKDIKGLEILSSTDFANTNQYVAKLHYLGLGLRKNQMINQNSFIFLAASGGQVVYKEVGAFVARLDRGNNHEIDFQFGQRNQLAANINLGYVYQTKRKVRLEFSGFYNTSSKLYGVQFGFSKFFITK